MASVHVKAARKYARDITSGRIPACKLTRLACARQINDLKRVKEDPAWPYYFDDKAADRVCRFIELLSHVKGKWAKQRQPIRLEPWQQFILTTVFGWKRKADGLRRFRTVYEEVARKNAKSTKLSGVSLYMLALDGEVGAEVYSAATKKEQAKIVFGVARSMANKSTEFRVRYGVEVFAGALAVPSMMSSFRPLDAEGKTQDGLNIHFVAVDELHAHKTRTLYDALETGTGSREQPLIWIITTAGSDQSGICYEQRAYVTKILQGIFADETYFGIIYTLDDGDDWADQANWIKANPNLGVSVFLDDMERLAAKAVQTAAARNPFKTKRLNMWVNAGAAWMDMDAWAGCGDPDLDPADFAGEDCIQSADLASKVDINSRVKLFERDVDGVTHYYAFATHYLPEDTVKGEENAQYEGWAEDGYLVATGEAVIDMDTIEDDILADAELFPTREFGYDPYQATQLSTHIGDAGIETVEVRPTVLNFSEPMKELHALVLQGRFHHSCDPVLTWMVSNVVCHMDRKDNIYPRKEGLKHKIDGAVALIMAFNRALAGDESGPNLAEALKRRGIIAA